MSIETIIAHRTRKKEIRLSGELCLTRTQWEERGGIYHGSLKQASKEGYFTVRGCEILKQPVTTEEFLNCKDFAMFKSSDIYLYENGNRVCPCLPVFYRGSL